MEGMLAMIVFLKAGQWVAETEFTVSTEAELDTMFALDKENLVHAQGYDEFRITCLELDYSAEAKKD